MTKAKTTKAAKTEISESAATENAPAVGTENTEPTENPTDAADATKSDAATGANKLNKLADLLKRLGGAPAGKNEDELAEAIRKVIAGRSADDDYYKKVEKELNTILDTK